MKKSLFVAFLLGSSILMEPASHAMFYYNNGEFSTEDRSDLPTTLRHSIPEGAQAVLIAPQVVVSISHGHGSINRDRNNTKEFLKSNDEWYFRLIWGQEYHRFNSQKKEEELVPFSRQFSFGGKKYDTTEYMQSFNAEVGDKDFGIYILDRPVEGAGTLFPLSLLPSDPSIRQEGVLLHALSWNGKVFTDEHARTDGNGNKFIKKVKNKKNQWGFEKGPLKAPAGSLHMGRTSLVGIDPDVFPQSYLPVRQEVGDQADFVTPIGGDSGSPVFAEYEMPDGSTRFAAAGVLSGQNDGEVRLGVAGQYQFLHPDLIRGALALSENRDAFLASLQEAPGNARLIVRPESLRIREHLGDWNRMYNDPQERGRLYPLLQKFLSRHQNEPGTLAQMQREFFAGKTGEDVKAWNAELAQIVGVPGGQKVDVGTAAPGAESAADEANAQRLSQAVQKLALKPNATVAEAGKPLRALLQRENYSPAAVKAVMDGFLGKSRLHSLKLEVLDAASKTNRTLTVDEARMGLEAAQGMGAYLQTTNNPALVEANNRKSLAFQNIIDDADPAKRVQKAEGAKIEELTQAVQKLGLKPNATVAEAGPKLRGFLQSNGYSPAAVKAVMDGFLGKTRLFSLKVSLLELAQAHRSLNPSEARLGMEAAQALLGGVKTPENEARLKKFKAAGGKTKE